ncbi:hypothetical protein ARGLB_032_00170 [Arthrobacter globiformis NBRC 12137]|uniref:NERD domain-containing protein n=1 Tax=Arthrobacter globiformis (strain ATCC 8010 / DSM 20124 / JCM 1332 / NBRC 12137 / NCIMB 8907 / NRRL B-2979 / 168) TaxID=1077972 RepID=H0QJH1_ARTG1|nr:hypothetical protein ARGLB_032_00170 [Arthrobacter globiformis NBRC 12137]
MAERLAQLGPYGWFLLHDVHWPGRPLARLEHVLVGPGGVVVVSAKNWSGHVDVVEGTLRQNGHDRFPAVETALAQAAAVAAVLPAPRRRLVRSLICLTAQPELQGTTGSGIEVRGMDCIAAAVTDLPDVLDAPSVLLLYAQLGQLLTRPQVPEAGTVGNQHSPDTRRADTPRPETSPAALRRPVHGTPCTAVPFHRTTFTAGTNVRAPCCASWEGRSSRASSSRRCWRRPCGCCGSCSPSEPASRAIAVHDPLRCTIRCRGGGGNVLLRTI